jgi:hypothetical protein
LKENCCCFFVTRRSTPKSTNRVGGRAARFFLVQLTKAVKNIPNDHKMYQMDIRYTKWLLNIPNGHKIYQHFTFQGPPKFTQIGIFGLKRNHLATLVGGGQPFLKRFVQASKHCFNS